MVAQSGKHGKRIPDCELRAEREGNILESGFEGRKLHRSERPKAQMMNVVQSSPSMDCCWPLHYEVTGFFALCQFLSGAIDDL